MEEWILKKINNLKKKYLSTMTEQDISVTTAEKYASFFSRIDNYESDYNKDLMYFKIDEIENILYGFKSNSINTIEQYSRIISKYLNWGVQEGIINKSPLADFRPDDFIKYLTNNDIYFTDKDLKRYEEKCLNYQDSSLIRLLFIGVGGKHLSEIRNLRKDDVDLQNKRLRLINSLKEDKSGNPVKFTERLINVDDRTLELINGAIEEKIYKNGFKENNELIDNCFVIRASKTDVVNAKNAVDKSVINRRIRKIAEVCGLKELDEKLIKDSGIIYTAYQDMIDEEISSNDLKIIASKFNINNYQDLKGIVTLENIRVTYNNFDLDEDNDNFNAFQEEEENYHQGVEEKLAKKLSDEELETRAKHASKKATSRHVTINNYERETSVTEYAKRWAKGICQLCDAPAPFKNKKGEPHLHTHHVEWLSRGGEDSIENTVALCPNCHDRMHILDLPEDIMKLKDKVANRCKK